jgi:hypothetical protein
MLEQMSIYDNQIFINILLYIIIKHITDSIKQIIFWMINSFIILRCIIKENNKIYKAFVYSKYALITASTNVPHLLK